nr:ribonuclease H-like domain-containing protein [Tanacetum cinerariifolium]
MTKISLYKRTKDMLTGKWAKLNANYQKFNHIYKHLQRLSKSGENEVDLLAHVRQACRDESKGSELFAQDNAWEKLTSRTKHIEIDIHFVLDLVAAGQARILHVPSPYQYADIFTKGLPSAMVEEFYTILSVLSYVSGTMDYGLQLFSSSTTDLDAYSYADWAEVEYDGVANVVAKTCWLKSLLRELHTLLSSATVVYCENVSAVYLSSNPVQHQRTKHIEIDIHF